ncbi:ATP-grasp domain-containing protein [Xanthobacteraceae bacterium A53D]
MDIAVIAQWAHPLVASATRAGLSPLSLDLFAHLDTCAKATRCVRVHRTSGYGFDSDDLIAALTHLGPAGLPVVLGSGLEDDPDLMARIAATNRILGNGPETVRVLKDPLALAALCGTLRIPFPEVTLEAPDDAFAARPVLEKKIGGSGGFHIRRRPAGDRSAPADGRYLQQEVAGEVYSLLLIANGSAATVVGACRQWHAPDDDKPYRYGGLVGPVALPARHAAAVEAAARDLVRACGLVGLISVDVAIASDRWWLLEVTPRPGAILDILDSDPLPPLLQLHIAACGGQLPEALPEPQEFRACGALYAPEDILVPNGQWPTAAMDRPAPGTAIKAGTPVCAIRASGTSAAAAEDQLSRRFTEVRAWLGLEAVDVAV